MANKKKWTSELAQRLAGGQKNDLVDVIVEIRSPEPEPHGGAQDRTKRIEILKGSFDQRAKPIVERIAALGGKVSNQTWLSSSITARLTPKALEEIGTDQSIDRIDVVRPPERD